MNVAGDGMCIPRDDGDGAGTNDDGDGTWRVGLPGDGAMEDGVTTGWREGGDASGKLAMPGDDWKIEKWKQNYSDLNHRKDNGCQAD